uniref:Large ribosomal subunit protein uL23c n=1 Tax=Vertebrata lanosa TaxID=1261582 RepID=A0A0B5VUR2_9FLOR|nr:50S ribosomal protein L23 [Vertebrata lanosa]AJH65928.1 50S ribosomal protein L23 [Vertebrata lanosa]
MLNKKQIIIVMITKIKLDIIKSPIITDKTTKSIENNTYYFNVVRGSNKNEIKQAIEYLFNVKVKKVNTSNIPPKTKTVGRFKGKIARYKKAIVQLHQEYKIDLFDSE